MNALDACLELSSFSRLYCMNLKQYYLIILIRPETPEIFWHIYSLSVLTTFLTIVSEQWVFFWSDVSESRVPQYTCTPGSGHKQTNNSLSTGVHIQGRHRYSQPRMSTSAAVRLPGSIVPHVGIVTAECYPSNHTICMQTLRYRRSLMNVCTAFKSRLQASKWKVPPYCEVNLTSVQNEGTALGPGVHHKHQWKMGM